MRPVWASSGRARAVGSGPTHVDEQLVELALKAAHALGCLGADVHLVVDLPRSRPGRQALARRGVHSAESRQTSSELGGQLPCEGASHAAAMRAPTCQVKPTAVRHGSLPACQGDTENHAALPVGRSSEVPDPAQSP